MKIDKNHKLFSKVVLKDVLGHDVKYAKSYDTETNIAEIYMVASTTGVRTRFLVSGDGGENNNIVVATVTLQGSGLFYRDSQKEVPKEDL